MLSSFLRPAALWRRHPLGLGLAAALVAVTVLGLGTGVALLRLRPAHAATSVTDTTCTPTSYASDLAAAGTNGIITFQCAAPADILVGATATIGGGTTLTITSAGQPVTLDGNHAVRLFVVASGGSLTLDHLTVANGSAAKGGGLDEEGGGVSIGDSTFSGNQATNGGGGGFTPGGGLYIGGGTAAIADSTFSGNQATASGPMSTAAGGGLAIYGGTVTIAGSTISGNQATTTGNAFGPPQSFGGGLAIGMAGTVTIADSTFSGNQATSTGGGQASGGGMGLSGPTTITGSTISGNRVTGGSGGGVALSIFGPTTIADSIVAANTADVSGPNCMAPPGTLSDHGYNLEDSAGAPAGPSADCGFSAASHDVLVAAAADLHLGALGDHGGPTQTIDLQPGSPAIDAIPPAAGGCGTTLAADQRGVGRPQGAGCDIGAFELVGVSSALAVGTPQYAAGGVTYVTGATLLTVTGIADGSAVGSVSYCVYPLGGSCATFTTVAGASAGFVLTTARADGPDTVAFYASTTLGHQDATHTAALTLDDTAPAATLAIGQPQATVNGAIEVTSQTPLTLAATDAGAGVAAVSYRFFPKGGAAPAYTTVAGTTATFELTGADGVYEVDYDAADHLGNDPEQTAFLTLADATLLNGADVAAGPGGGGAPPGANGGPTGSQTGASGSTGATSGSAAGQAHAAPASGARKPASDAPPMALTLGLLALLLLLVAGGGGGFLYWRSARGRARG